MYNDLAEIAAGLQEDAAMIQGWADGAQASQHMLATQAEKLRQYALDLHRLTVAWAAIFGKGEPGPFGVGQ